MKSLKRIRLQGKEWHSRKHYLHMVAYGETKRGNIIGFYITGAKNPRSLYTHYLNDVEIAAFLSSPIKPPLWFYNEDRDVFFDPWSPKYEVGEYLTYIGTSTNLYTNGKSYMIEMIGFKEGTYILFDNLNFFCWHEHELDNNFDRKPDYRMLLNVGDILESRNGSKSIIGNQAELEAIRSRRGRDLKLLKKYSKEFKEIDRVHRLHYSTNNELVYYTIWVNSEGVV